MRRSPKPSRLSASLTLVSLLTLTSCAHPAPTLATSPVAGNPAAACAAFPRISYSRLHDTAETLTQKMAADGQALARVTGGATAADVLSFRNKVQEGVWNVFGVKLQPEPVFVGF